MIYSDNTYDITNDISTYTRTDFKSVYDTTREKWYMLNNLDAYEEYGIYGTDFSTYYTGKLVVVNDHEYEWNGAEWDDLGPYVDAVISVYRDASHNGYITFPYSTSDVKSIEATFNQTAVGGNTNFLIATGASDSNDWRVFYAGNEHAFFYDCGNARWNSTGYYGRKMHMRFDGYPMRLYDYDTSTYLYTTTSKNRPTGRNFYWGHYQLDFEGTGASSVPGYLYDVVLYSDNGETAIAHYVPYVLNGVAGLYDTINESFLAPTGEIAAEYSQTKPKEYEPKPTPSITSLWPGKLYRNNKYLRKLYRNDAEQAILDYMSDDKFKKGEMQPEPTSNAYIHIDATSYNLGNHPYIDLGYVPTSTTNVEMTYRLASSSFNVGDTRIFGMNGDSALYSPSGGFAARIRTGSSPNYYFEPTYGYNSLDLAASITPLQDFTVRFDQTTNSGYFTFYMNGNNILQWNVSSLLNLPLYVFMSNNNYGNFTNDAPHPDEWLKQFKIYEGDTLVCNFIPYIQNNVVGLYDTISGQFKAPTNGDMAYEI